MTLARLRRIVVVARGSSRVDPSCAPTSVIPDELAYATPAATRPSFTSSRAAAVRASFSTASAHVDDGAPPPVLPWKHVAVSTATRGPSMLLVAVLLPSIV